MRFLIAIIGHWLQPHWKVAVEITKCGMLRCNIRLRRQAEEKGSASLPRTPSLRQRARPLQSLVCCHKNKLLSIVILPQPKGVMKFERVKNLDDEKFRRLTGVKRATFVQRR